MKEPSFPMIMVFLQAILTTLSHKKYEAILEQEFYQWLANNFREVTAQPNTDIDFFNYLRICSKDGMYHKGMKLKPEDMLVIKKAEIIEIVCDKRKSLPIVIPPLLLEIKTVKVLFLKNIIIPSHTAIITKLKAIEEIELHSCTIYDITTLLPLDSKLKKLILHDCDIKNCLLDDKKVPHLEILIINNCNLHSINKEVFLLPNLKKIDLKNNQILYFPIFDPEDHPTTVELNLQRNRLAEYPKQLNQFTNLHLVNLSFNLIETFNEGFRTLLPLKILNLEGNLIKKLPEGIENLRELKKLELSHNGLEECNIEIFKLPKLEHLDLSFNKLRKLDETFSILSRGIFDAAGLAPGDAPFRLSCLDLSYNFLEDLPLSFRCFQSLTKLSLNGNLLRRVPDCVLNLTRLEVLHLSFNRLLFIPVELEKLNFLFEVHLLGGNDFRTVSGPTNQISRIPKLLLNQRSGRTLTFYVKNNYLISDSTLTEYGRSDIIKYYSSQVEM